MKRHRATIVLLAIAAAPAAYGQGGEAQPAFEVASVKPSAATTGKWSVRGGPGSSDPTLATFENVDLFSLVAMAYGVQRYELLAPDWMSSTRFDITARVPSGTAADRYRLMLQSLLAQRFHLTLHHDRKEIRMAELVVGKNGPKMKESAVDPAAPDSALGLQPPLPRAGPPPGYHGPFSMALQKASMARFAALLSGLLEEPVVDNTGLKGNYDFKFQALVGSAPPATEANNSLPSIIDAVQEQLGLKLVQKKDAVDVLVIDRIDKAPTGN